MRCRPWSLAVGSACLAVGCPPPAPDLEAEGRALFWGEIAGELLLIGGVGVVLVSLGRRSTSAMVNDD